MFVEKTPDECIQCDHCENLIDFRAIILFFIKKERETFCSLLKLNCGRCEMGESVPANKFNLIMKSFFLKRNAVFKGMHFGGSFRFIFHAHLSFSAF